MKIAVAQVRGQIDDPAANASKAKMLINNTDVDLLVFPEMFATGRDIKCGQFMKNMDALFFGKVNANLKAKKCSMLFGCPAEESGKLYNCAILTDGDNTQIYRKIHLSGDTRFPEKKIFAAGTEPVIFECGGMSIGVAAGNDIMFNELFRWYASRDVDMIICIAAVPHDTMEMYEKLLPARCAENSVEMIFVNMVGPDSGYVMAGNSRYISANGNIIESCSDSSDVRIIKTDEDRIKRSKADREALKEAWKERKL